SHKSEWRDSSVGAPPSARRVIGSDQYQIKDCPSETSRQNSPTNFRPVALPIRHDLRTIPSTHTCVAGRLRLWCLAGPYRGAAAVESLGAAGYPGHPQPADAPEITSPAGGSHPLRAGTGDLEPDLCCGTRQHATG